MTKSNKIKLKSTLSIIGALITLCVVVVLTMKLIDKETVIEKKDKGSNYIRFNTPYIIGNIMYKVTNIEVLEEQGSKKEITSEEETQEVILAITYNVINKSEQDLTFYEDNYLQLHNGIRNTRYDKRLTGNYMKQREDTISERPSKLLRGNEYEMVLLYKVNKKRYDKGQVWGYMQGVYFSLE